MQFLSVASLCYFASFSIKVFIFYITMYKVFWCIMSCSAHLPLFLSSWHPIPLPPLGISPNFCSENSKCQELAFQPPPWSEDAGLWLRLCHSNLSSQKCNWTSDRREWNGADLILQRMETMAVDPWPCWCPAWGGQHAIVPWPTVAQLPFLSGRAALLVSLYRTQYPSLFCWNQLKSVSGAQNNSRT